MYGIIAEIGDVIVITEWMCHILEEGNEETMQLKCDKHLCISAVFCVRGCSLVQVLTHFGPFLRPWLLVCAGADAFRAIFASVVARLCRC